MERKYDYHNYQYVLKQSENLKIQKKYQLIKKKKCILKMVIKNMNTLNTGK